MATIGDKQEQQKAEARELTENELDQTTGGGVPVILNPFGNPPEPGTNYVSESDGSIYDPPFNVHV